MSITGSALDRGREGAEGVAAAIKVKLLEDAARSGMLQWSKAVSQIAEKAMDKVDLDALKVALAAHPPLVYEGEEER